MPGRGARSRGGGPRPPFFEQPLGRLLDGGMVGDLLQAQLAPQLGPFPEDLLQAAVVDLEEVAEGQQGEVLVDGVVDVAVGVDDHWCSPARNAVAEASVGR